jgi:tetratricopeptide (TPR) repeat protein
MRLFPLFFIFIGAFCGTQTAFAQGFMSDEADADGWEPEYLEDISPVSAQKNTPQINQSTTNTTTFSRPRVTTTQPQASVNAVEVENTALAKAEAEKTAFAKAEMDRTALAKAEAEKAAFAKAEMEKAKAEAEKAAFAKAEMEKAKAEAEKTKAEAEKAAFAKAEMEKAKAEAEKAAFAKAEMEKAKAEAEKAAFAKAEMEKAKAEIEKAAFAKAEAEKAEAEKAAFAKAEIEKAAFAKAEMEKAKAEAEKAAFAKAEMEKAKAEAEKAAFAKAEMEKVKAEAEKAAFAKAEMAKAAILNSRPTATDSPKINETLAVIEVERTAKTNVLTLTPEKVTTEARPTLALPDTENEPIAAKTAPNMLISGQKMVEHNNSTPIFAPKPAARNPNTNLNTLNIAKTTIYDLVGNDRDNYQAAYLYFAANDFAEAAPLLEKIVANQKSFADGYRMLVECFEDKKDYKKAIAAYERYLELMPNNEKDWYNVSLLYAKNDQLEQAIAACERAVSIKSDYEKAQRRLLALYGATNNTTALETKKDAKSLYQLAVIHTRNKKSEEAIAAVNRIEKPSADALYLKAVALRKLNRADEAMETYQKVIAQSPEYIDAHADLGVLYYNKQDFAQAATSFGIAQSLKISDLQLAFFYGKALLMTNEPKRAITYLERVVAAQPSNAEARKFLDMAYANQDAQPQSSANLVSTSSSSSDKSRIKNHNEGVKALADNDPYTAITVLTKALAADPKQPATNYALGLAYLEVKENEKALTYFKNATTADPNYLKAYEATAKTYYNMKNGDAAIAAYEAVLQQKGGKTAQNYQEIATVYALMEEPTKALQYFKLANELQASNPETLYNMGTTALQANQFNAAIGYFAQAIALKPNYLAAYYNKGQAHLKLEQTDIALQIGEKMIKINPDYSNGYMLCALAYSKLNDTMNQVKYERIADKLAGK